MFERIVAAIDSDPERTAKVLDATAELARGRLARVLVAHVREVERPAPILAKAGALPPALHVGNETEAAQMVETSVRRLRESGIEATASTPGVSASAVELLQLADSEGSNLIIVGDRGSSVSDLLQGGVAHRIVHLANCPVLVVR